MFIAVSFTIAGNVINLSTFDEWIYTKISYIHTMTFYSTAKINEIMKFIEKWMEFGNILLC